MQGIFLLQTASSAVESCCRVEVVILVDEYDKPILDHITDIETARSMRDRLKNIYSVIKDSDEFIKFVFITGVSKFSKVNLFSGLNNLEDITLDHRYATICGYTHNDLLTTFKAHLQDADMAKVKDWYNGYNYLGEKVYNPFDILLFISKGVDTFNGYWWSTGNPSFLIELLKSKHYFIPELSHYRADSVMLDSFDVDHIELVALLWQTGEVLRYQQTIYDVLNQGDVAALEGVFTRLFASIPYQHFTNNKLQDYEGYYTSVIYAYIASLGFETIPEDSTNHGRIDLTLKMEGKVFLFEVKVVDKPEAASDAAGEDKALAQIKSRLYARSMRVSLMFTVLVLPFVNRRVMCVGLSGNIPTQ